MAELFFYMFSRGQNCMEESQSTLTTPHTLEGKDAWSSSMTAPSFFPNLCEVPQKVLTPLSHNIEEGFSLHFLDSQENQPFSTLRKSSQNIPWKQ